MYKLSLKNGTPIAMINKDKNDLIYVKDDKEGDGETVDTTAENKLKIFTNYIHMNPKLSMKEINEMIQAYKDGTVEIDGKNSRLYDKALEFTKNSTRQYLDYGRNADLFPVIKEMSYRIYVTGMSNSGKSWWVKEFLKHNKPKDALVFLFSPVKEDRSLKDVKNLVHVDINEFEEENKREMDIEDFPNRSVIVMDDVETETDLVLRKKYLKLRDEILQRGRHAHESSGEKEFGISIITISHNPLGGTLTKNSIRESSYFLIFPHLNKRDSATLLKTYAGYTKHDIDEVMAQKTRWLLVKKSVPCYFIGEHSVRLMS